MERTRGRELLGHAMDVLARTRAEVRAHEFPLARFHDLGERVAVDVLDALDARPPAWKVVRIFDDLPQALKRRGDRPAAAGRRHR